MVARVATFMNRPAFSLGNVGRQLLSLVWLAVSAGLLLAVRDTSAARLFTVKAALFGGSASTALYVTLAIAMGVMLFAGILKGSTGFGAQPVAVPALALLVGTKPAILLVFIPVLVTNVWLMLGRRVDPALLRRFVPLIAALVPATIVGSILLAKVNVLILSTIVGVVALVYVMLTLLGKQFNASPRYERAVSMAIGAGVGLVNGSTGIPGPFVAMYFSGLKLDKLLFVYVITFIFLTGNVVQLLTYSKLGLYPTPMLLGAAALVPPFLLGQNIGLRIQDRLNPELFRRGVLVIIAISGLNLLAKGLGWL